MRRRLAPLGIRGLVALSVVTAVAVGVALRDGGPGRKALPAVVGLEPSDVRRLVVEAGGQQANLTRQGTGWFPEAGTPPQSAPLLYSIEGQLLPMLAYRAVAADPTDPQYGLVEPEVAVRLQDDTGEQITILIGAASFSGAGFYALRQGDPHRVYLVPRNTMDLLRSLITGRPTTSADLLSDRAGRYQAEREQAERDKDVTTYLRQVLDAGGRTPPPVG